MGLGIYIGKDFMEKICFSLECKSEGVLNDETGDGEGDESEEDWLVVELSCAKLVKGYSRWGDVYRNERFVIPKKSKQG